MCDNTESISGRKPELEAQLIEIYKIIKGFHVVSSGTIFVDTNQNQTGLFFCSGGSNPQGSPDLYTEFLKNPEPDEIRDIFSLLDEVFETGIQIGIRESLRLLKEHIAIYTNSKECIGYSTNELKILAEGLIAIMDSIAYRGLRAGILEAITAAYLNYDIVNNPENIKYWYIDYSKKGNGKLFDVSTVTIFDILDSIWEQKE